MTYRIINGDCLDVLRGMDAGSVDAVVTDPPYPDCHTEIYQYDPRAILALNRFKCRQLVFWSKSTDFPLDYTAVHIWNKNPSNHGAQYERIFERNGSKHYKVYTFYMINSTVAAQMTRDVYTGHPSQKPINLLMQLIEEHTRPGDTVLDPFCGSGSTGVACVRLGRNFIGVEIDAAYCAIAERRLAEAEAQPSLFAGIEATP